MTDEGGFDVAYLNGAHRDRPHPRSDPGRSHLLRTVPRVGEAFRRPRPADCGGFQPTAMGRGRTRLPHAALACPWISGERCRGTRSRARFNWTMTRPRYVDHLDTLIALATYLALTPKTSRTCRGLAIDLSLPEDEVRSALTGFPGVFRKSRNLSSEGEPFYTLHARYALRIADADAEAQDLAELRSDLLSALLQFASQQAAQESATDQFQRQLTHSLRGTWVAAGAAVVAAVLAAIAAIVAR